MVGISGLDNDMSLEEIEDDLNQRNFYEIVDMDLLKSKSCKITFISTAKLSKLRTIYAEVSPRIHNYIVEYNYYLNLI